MLLLLTLLALAPRASNLQEPVRVAVKPEDGDTFASLSQAFDDAYSAWIERMRAAENDEQRDELMQGMPQLEFTPRFLALAERERGKQDAYDALAWVHRYSQDRAAKAQAFALLERDHAESEALAELCSQLYVIEVEAEAFLAKLAEKSPYRAVRGQALHALGQLFMRRASLAQRLAEVEEEELASYRENYGAETVAAVRAADPAAVRRAAEAAFERVAADYGDLESWRSTLQVSAERNLFELRNLGLGQVAPDIAGEDIEGVAFKLSDYRGKVVVLDFWGNW
jgi:hypothetical protein